MSTLAEPTDPNRSVTTKASVAPIHPLTAVRFFAAMAVVVTHTCRFAVDGGPAWLQNLVYRGTLGVSFFFILSGFILMVNYQGPGVSGSRQLRDFYVNRLARIYPMYFVALLLAVVPTYAHVRAQGEVYSPAYWATFVFSKLTMTNAWYRPFVNQPPWLDLGWTLAVETFFYASFPFLLRPLLKLPVKGLVGLCLLCAILTWLPKQLGEMVDGRNGLDWMTFFPLARLPEFVGGMCLARLFTERQRDGAVLPAATVPILGVLTILLLAVLPAPSDASPVFILVTLGFGALILALAEARGWAQRALSGPFIVLLGEASYSLYLVHGTVLWVAVLVQNKVFGRDWRTDPWLLLPTVAAAILFSVVCYRLVETPSRRAIRRWAKGPKTAR
jgi:peptidoglycan/LPS O-acetylase OafA/YrhL